MESLFYRLALILPSSVPPKVAVSRWRSRMAILTAGTMRNASFLIIVLKMFAFGSPSGAPHVRG